MGKLKGKRPPGQRKLTGGGGRHRTQRASSGYLGKKRKTYEQKADRD